MRYYKPLNLDWSQTKKEIEALATPEWVEEMIFKSKPENHKDGGAFQGTNWEDITNKIPSLLTLFEPLNIHPFMASFFVLRDDLCDIHIDNAKRPVRINIPVLNCEHSSTQYFDSEYLRDDMPFYTQPNGKGCYVFPEETVRLLDEFTLIEPTALRVLVPHRVKCFGPYPRISLLINFSELSIEHLLND